MEKHQKKISGLSENLNLFSELHKNLLIGASRKSFIGHALDLPIEERLEGTAACITVAMTKGANIFRVHDIKQIRRIIDMTEKIIQ